MRRPGQERGSGAGSGWCAIAFLAACALFAAPALALGVGGDARVDPADFRITTFATGLDYPTSMQLLEDGSLLVLTNVPTNGLFDATGELVRLVDADEDGVADGPPQVLATGLPSAATSLRISGSLVFVQGRPPDAEAITILRLGANPSDPITSVGVISLVFPTPAPFVAHRNVALAVAPHDGAPTFTDVYFNVGAEGNSTDTTDTFDVGGLAAGLPGATKRPMDAIHRVTVEDTGGTPALSGLVQIGAGLRNAAGIAVHPGTGDLWFSENGIDPGPGVDQSADELNRITFGDLGGAVEDFGFADGYVTYRTGSVVGGGIQPVVAFQPFGDPNTGAESEGAVEIAFAPPGFPAGLRDGVFVGFHGRFNLAGVANEENPVVFVDLATLDSFHFIGNTEPGVGHPNGLLASEDSLFVADLASGGSVTTNSVSGVIHQIQGPGVSPVPSVPALWPLALVGMALWVARRAMHGPAASR